MEEFELFSRGKSKKDNVWIYGDSVHWWGKQKTKPDICIYNNIGRFDVIQKTIGDFIGLRDKNNKPIFEDDVVLYDGKEKALVVYQPSEYVLIFKSHEYPQRGLLTRDNQNKIEIIGNVIDNPELLEEIK
jgi:hypothetical protein